MSVVRRTPLHGRHVAAGGHLVDFAGWEMPQHFSSVRDEQRAVRTAAGLFDVSHMGRLVVEGDEAGAFLQSVVTNDLDRIGDGQAQYNLLCLPDGGVLDDLVVYRGNPWRLVVNAANREQDRDWLVEHAPPGVTVRDVSDELALLALQGPQAQALLPAEHVDLEGLSFFGWTYGTVAGVDGCVVSRTGYTGEDGFELFVPSDRAPGVWDALLSAGATPCGLAARDVCRLEAGLRLHGSDMDAETNPYEAGLGWTVKLQKGEFVGREALQRVRSEGPSRKLIGLRGEGRTIPRHGAAVSCDGSDAGSVTSGTYSFWLERGIGMALVQATIAAGRPEGSHLTVDLRGRAGDVEVARLPFYRGSVRQP
ncbi:MAG TPA: glycine cleavage system aminomethyltransferase GcvT [Candidatus Binatia bacterium]|nr:glycine cleavage system aminomethyltransferase GcvT [Candidatus Binatia bacterium]